MSRNALIVGGGIGGLACAVHLSGNGWDVQVRERAAGLPATGTALGMWPSALRALDALGPRHPRLGIGDTVRARGSAQVAGGFLRADGSRIGDVDVAAMRRRTGDTVHLVSRPTLLRTLAEALDDGVVRYGEEVPDVREAAADHDVVVAADGLNSRARRLLFGPGYATRYTGVTSWRGTVDGETRDTTETWGNAARFGITPHEGGRTNWFACVRAPERAVAAGGDLAALHTRFGGWHAEVRRVLAELERADGSGILRHDLYDLARPLPSYVRGRIALIGDAAHAMTPDLGRGACEALIDGLALARELVTRARVEDALAAYDAARRRPTQRLARVARLVNRAVHTPGAAPVRDPAMRLLLAVSSPPA